MDASSPGSPSDSSGRRRLLIVDDHEVVRIGLRQLFDAQPDLEVCGEAETLAEARAAIPALGPDVVVLDLTLGEESGLDLLRWLHTAWNRFYLYLLDGYEQQLDTLIGEIEA